MYVKVDIIVDYVDVVGFNVVKVVDVDVVLWVNCYLDQGGFFIGGGY